MTLKVLRAPNLGEAQGPGGGPANLVDVPMLIIATTCAGVHFTSLERGN
jgi:hypothetical protein